MAVFTAIFVLRILTCKFFRYKKVAQLKKHFTYISVFSPLSQI